jgi:hypothetical protein
MDSLDEARVRALTAEQARWDAEEREAVRGMADPPHYELNDGTCVGCGEPWMCEGSLR